MPDDELLEASGFTDTVDNKPEPDTRPLNVYRVSATDHVNWTCNIVARDAEEAYLRWPTDARSACSRKACRMNFKYTRSDEADVSHHGVKPTDDPHVWVMSDGETIDAFGQEATNG